LLDYHSDLNLLTIKNIFISWLFSIKHDSFVEQCEYCERILRYYSTSLGNLISPLNSHNDCCQIVYVKQFEGSDNGIEGIKVVHCGIHVMVEKTDSFEGSERDHDIDNQEESAFEYSEGGDGINKQESKVISSPPYHLLHHPLDGLQLSSGNIIYLWSPPYQVSTRWKNSHLTSFGR